ncbi:Uncharacterised protein [Streptococcus sobrinus]|nr:Uncharacterised protein [Streptococcus sobrinus]
MSNQVIEQFLVYLIFSLLYLMINATVIINIGKSGIGLLSSIIGLWILPDLVNYIFSRTDIFDIQLAYYLSPNTFRGITSIFNILVPFSYIVLFYILSIFQFNRKEF